MGESIWTTGEMKTGENRSNRIKTTSTATLSNLNPKQTHGTRILTKPLITQTNSLSLSLSLSLSSLIPHYFHTFLALPKWLIRTFGQQHSQYFAPPTSNMIAAKTSRDIMMYFFVFLGTSFLESCPVKQWNIITVPFPSGSSWHEKGPGTDNSNGTTIIIIIITEENKIYCCDFSQTLPARPASNGILESTSIRRLHYIQIFSSYRAVNIPRVGYKNKSVDTV